MKKIMFFMISVVVIVLNVNIHKSTTLISLISEQLEIINYEYSEGYECVVLGGDMDNVLNLLDVQVANRMEIEDRIIIEGYTPKLVKNENVDNQKINIQLSYFDGVVVVGYPLIKKSF